VAGAIAASAPVLGFPDEPGFDPSAFWQVSPLVTFLYRHLLIRSIATGCEPTRLATGRQNM